MDDYEKYLTNDIALTIHLKHTIHNAPEAISAEFLRLRKTLALHSGKTEAEAHY